MGNLLKKNSCQEIPKIAQSGHTAGKCNSLEHIGVYISAAYNLYCNEDKKTENDENG